MGPPEGRGRSGISSLGSTLGGWEMVTPRSL